jgi:hypothetical protein
MTEEDRSYIGGGALSHDEIVFVTDAIETILSDTENKMGFFDVTSSGAMKAAGIAEYRDALYSAQGKLYALIGSPRSPDHPYSPEQLAVQAKRFATYVQQAMSDSKRRDAIVFADCLAIVACEIAAGLRAYDPGAVKDDGAGTTKGKE